MGHFCKRKRAWQAREDARVSLFEVLTGHPLVIVLVDGTSAASPFPATAHVVTDGGTDVTEKAHFAVRNGVASICFAQGTVVIFR